MDPKAQMPKIKPEVNKVPGGDKKKRGLLASLFGGGSGGGAGGLGGSAAAGGGLLATKAGLIALVVIGSAVAGGIGLAGYKMFGPAEADRADGGNFQLFAPRPKAEQADAGAPAAAGKDGSSASLDYMAQAAAKDKAADAAAAPPTDQTAADAAKDVAAKAAGADALNSGSGAGAVGAMGKGLAGVKKLGALSSSGGSGGSSASAGVSGRLGDALATASRNGATSAFSRGGSGRISASAGRAVASRRSIGSAHNQAFGVLGDHRGAGSSMAAGVTYDGASAGGNIGDGNGIGTGGTSDGTGAQPKSINKNAVGDVHEETPPVTPVPKDVTPWDTEMNVGLGLGAAAILMLMYASSQLKEAKAAAMAAIGTPAYAAAASKMWLLKLLIGAAIAAALGGVTMGTLIATGENSQTLQGGLLIASSAAIAAAGTLLMISASIPTPADAQGMDADEKVGAFSDPSKWIYVIGGIGAVGLATTMLTDKKHCKEYEDGKVDCSEKQSSIQRQPKGADVFYSA